MKGFSMLINKIKVGAIETNCYILSNDQHEAAIIDPGDEIKSILPLLDQLDLKYILITHGHYDHVLAVNDLLSLYKDVQIVSHKNGLEVLSTPLLNLAQTFTGKDIDIKPNLLLEDDEKIQLGDVEIRLIYIGGHSIDCACYYIEKENTIFTGDTLFKGTIGRTDLEKASLTKLKENIANKLFVLPDETVVYPGHGTSTTIGYEKEHNDCFL